MVVDALSRRPMSSLSQLRVVHLPRLIELRSLGVGLELTDSGVLLATFHVRPVLIDRIRELQIQDPQIVQLRGERGFVIERGWYRGHGIEVMCHAPIPGLTRLADPNWFPGRENSGLGLFT